MSILSDLRFRIRALFQRRSMDNDLDDELRFHFEKEVEKHRAAGLTEKEALRQARLAFGGPSQIAEDCREARGTSLLENVLRDVDYALRQMKKSPGFAVTAILTLALGIGGVTAVFSVVYAVLLRPLPYPQASQLVVLHEALQHLLNESNLSAPDITIFQRESHAFDGVGGFIDQGYDVTGAGEPYRAKAERVSAQMFPVLGVAPLIGRTLTAKEDTGSAPVAVISYAMWKDRFGGSPDVLGRTIDLDLTPYTIVGVMPRGFETPSGLGWLQTQDLWVPLSLTPTEEKSEGDNFDYGAVARLKPGVTMAQAQQDSERVLKVIQAKIPYAHLSVMLRGLKEQAVSSARPLLRSLLGAVVLILLIACANLANLLLVRGAGRRREFGVRMALGAARKTMLRQLLIESLLLSAMGGALGLSLAALLVEQAPRFLPDSLPRITEIAIHWPVALLAVGLIGATGLLCGLAPALASAKADVLSSLREGGQATGQGRTQHRVRSALAVVEMALAMLLLAGAGLLLRSFARMLETNPGFQPDHVLTANLSLPKESYPTQQSVDEFFSSLAERVRAMPGVETVGFTSGIPLTGDHSNRAIAPEGYVRRNGEKMLVASSSFVLGDYFQAMRIPLIDGRYLNARDEQPGAPLVIVVSQSYVKEFFGGRDPVGMHVKCGMSYSSEMPAMTVVGVVGDVKPNPIDQGQPVQMYEPIAQAAADLGPIGDLIGVAGNMHVVVRTAGDPNALEETLTLAVRHADPTLAVANLQTMEDVVSSTEAPRRFNTWVLTAFAAVALGLALLGIYGVLAYSVTERTREIAIRMALGATQKDVERRTLGDALVLGAAGVALGLAASVALTRYLASLLYEVKPLDGSTLAGAVVVLVACAALAGWIPARRAAEVDPMRALRSQ
jgi:putative ABC transport system permease protein